MMMVSKQHGVATGWALASGNVQERWVAERLFRLPGGGPAGARAAGGADPPAHGPPTHHMDGRVPQLWCAVALNPS